MAQLTTLGMLGGLLLTGTLSGVYLGNSAVNEINPSHFRGPSIHPRDRAAAVDPNQHVKRSAFAGAIWYGDKPRLEGPDCGDCDIYRLALRSAGIEPDRDVEETQAVGFSDAVEVGRDFPEGVEAAVNLAEAAHREALAQVERYARASYNPERRESGHTLAAFGPTGLSE